MYLCVGVVQNVIVVWYRVDNGVVCYGLEVPGVVCNLETLNMLFCDFRKKQLHFRLDLIC